MTTPNEDFERSMHEYAEYSDRVNARIDTLLPEYGIVEADVEVDAHAAMSEQIIRVKIARLVENRGTEELTARDLYEMKREALVELLAEDHFAVDSPWVDLINDLATPDDLVVFDEELFKDVEKARKSYQAVSASIQQDIHEWFNGLTPEERLALERDEVE